MVLLFAPLLCNVAPDESSIFRFLLSLGCGFKSDPRTVSVLL